MIDNDEAIIDNDAHAIAYAKIDQINI